MQVSRLTDNFHFTLETTIRSSNDFFASYSSGTKRHDSLNLEMSEFD